MGRRTFSSKASCSSAFDASERWGDAPCPCLGWRVHSAPRAKAVVNTVTMNLGWAGNTIDVLCSVLVGIGIYISLSNSGGTWTRTTSSMPGFQEVQPVFASLPPSFPMWQPQLLSHTLASLIHIGYHCPTLLFPVNSTPQSETIGILSYLTTPTEIKCLQAPRLHTMQ